MDLTKESIVEIERLTTEANKVETLAVQGRMFATKILHEITEKEYEIKFSQKFNDIDGLLTYLNLIKDHSTLEGQKILIHCDYNYISVDTTPDVKGEVTKLAGLEPSLPNIRFNTYLSLEEFIIQLQTKFFPTDNTKNLIQLVSKFQTNQEVTVADDGISQRVVIQKGQGLNEKIQLTPIVRLQAYRTFREILQIETLYLLRINSHGEIALFEADGGVWKFEAQKNVRTYIREQVKKLGLEDRVEVL